MSVKNYLLTEKLRPTTIKQMILPKRISSQFENGLIQNVLLVGTPGSGKTTLARVLSKDKSTLYINASEERGIDVVREKVMEFCSTLSLDGDSESVKHVILDEIDGATDEFFKALRAVTEKYHQTARFICTCNYINKIPDPIQSRFLVVNFDPVDEDEYKEIFDMYFVYTRKIVEKLGMVVSDEVLTDMLKNKIPDFRAVLNDIQSCHIKGYKEITPDILKKTYQYSDLFNLIVTSIDPVANYKTIISEYSSRVDGALESLSTSFIEYLIEFHPNKLGKIPLVMITVAEHQHQRCFVIDPVVTLLSCVYKIQLILNQ